VLNVLLDVLNAKPGEEARPYGDGESTRRNAEILISGLEETEPGAELTLKMAKDGRSAAPRIL
jgi:hypothetical protein